MSINVSFSVISRVRSLLRAGVQPTLDSSAETFRSVQCTSPGRKGELVGVCGVCASCVGWRKGWVGVSSLTVKNFKFLKSKMAAAAILKNRKIAISRPWFERYLRNLAHWCTYHNLPWYQYCFRGRVRLGWKGRFWCVACKSVSLTCSTSTLFLLCL